MIVLSCICGVKAFAFLCSSYTADTERFGYALCNITNFIAHV